MALICTNLIGYGQTYFVSVKNSLYYQNTGGASYCFRSNPASVPSVAGFLRLEDKNGIVLQNTDGDFTLNTRPAKFIENSGSCRWIEGSNRGSTYSLGGYTFTIPENQNAYYEVKTFQIAAPSAIYFETIDNSPKELNCNGGTVISAPSVVPSSDIIEWEYSINSTVGVVNNSQNKQSITISLNSFQVNLRDNIGKTIFFRFKMNNGIQSSFKGYKIVSCSPDFHSINKTDTTCNYTTDGGFKLNVKRNLNSGEELVITLYDANNNALVGQEFTTSLLNNGGGNYGYLWTGNLDGGNYSVKYQSHNGSGGINPNDSSWNSLNSVGTFEVKKPQSVNFSITNSSDENCFEINDGYIDISASREPGRGLFFQLTKDGTVQIFNGTNWVNYTGANPNDNGFNSFTSTTTTRINKLGKGTYRVKVRDAQKCYMRNNN
ncbi:Gliding motility-associated C-terminal domain-containing protein [Tenacibaculum sp. 190524A05c]